MSTQRGEGGRWLPGQSANPGGRKRETAEVRELARQHTKAAIQALADIMADGDKDAARVAAAEALLNRGWGRPEQAVQLEGADGESLTVVVQSLAEVTREEATQASGGDSGARDD